MKTYIYLPTGGFAVTDGLTVNSGGLLVTGGVTIKNNGLVIDSGGLTVTAGGLTLNSLNLATIPGPGTLVVGGAST